MTNRVERFMGNNGKPTPPQDHGASGDNEDGHEHSPRCPRGQLPNPIDLHRIITANMLDVLGDRESTGEARVSAAHILMQLNEVARRL